MEEKKIPALIGIEIFGRDGKVISSKAELIKAGISLKDDIETFVVFINEMEKSTGINFTELHIKIKDFCGIFIMQDKLFVAHCKDEDAFEQVEKLIFAI